MTSNRMWMKLFVPLAALSAVACSVDEAGKIKCVDDSSCPPPPFECTECCEISCDFLPGLRQGSNAVLQRGLAVRLRR